MRRTFALGGCAISIVLVLGGLGIYLKSLARYTVVGPTDPATGIRIEFTVSSRYVRTISDDRADDRPKRRNDGFQDWKYTSRASSPWMNWLRTKILREPPDTQEEAEGFSQSSSKHTEIAGWFVDSRGFVSVDLKRVPRMVMAAVDSQQYKMVGDCPTTMLVEDSDLVVYGHPMQYHDLLVRPKGQTIIYVFQATSIEGDAPSPDLRELKAIQDSIRVVKTR